ncbi:alpha/beta hydrolase [Sphingomonas sp. PP-F2F-A104-K0414]|uniref:alpha/beta fold hydrolase n=1 Tax=Sphingomonas sp. PP-F2F-A104-K0414 TaxID=2135661 RepID=UPI0014044E8E|nr:alpha/beta hydrolase [Sphingomonas sp. PP-F2F-A104-K0414]
MATMLAVGSSLHARWIERGIPADGQFITVEGVRIHYRDAGCGRPIVMIHGLGGQMRNFDYGLLDRLIGKHRLILIDRPGSGYSQSAGTSDIETQARVIAGVIAKLGLHRPLVVGHSLGGAVALALALAHPDHVGRLALICPLTLSQSDRPSAFRALEISSPLIRSLVAQTVATPASLLGRARQAELIFSPDPVPDDFGVRGGGNLISRPRAFAAASADYAMIPSSIGRLEMRYSELKTPTAVLFGRDDAILDPAVHGDRFIGTVPSATLELIDGGHMILVTRPDAVADWISRQASKLATGLAS